MVGRRDPSEYIYIEAVLNWDSRRAEMRLNPVFGQPFPEDMYIECSKEIRALHPGTRIRLKVVEKNPKGKHHQKHLYSSYKWNYEVLD